MNNMQRFLENNLSHNISSDFWNLFTSYRQLFSLPISYPSPEAVCSGTESKGSMRDSKLSSALVIICSTLDRPLFSHKAFPFSCSKFLIVKKEVFGGGFQLLSVVQENMVVGIFLKSVLFKNILKKYYF